MTISSSNGAHSAIVRMRLILNGTTFRISQMGPDFLLVDSPTNNPPGGATIEFQVDDSRRSWEVNLPHGMQTSQERVELSSAA